MRIDGFFRLQSAAVYQAHKIERLITDNADYLPGCVKSELSIAKGYLLDLAEIEDKQHAADVLLCAEIHTFEAAPMMKKSALDEMIQNVDAAVNALYEQALAYAGKELL